MSTTACLIIGASGYVGGEFLRLIDQHPQLHTAAAVSDSLAGQRVGGTFAHLRGEAAEQSFIASDKVDAVLANHDHLAVLCAAPHGGAAATLATLIGKAKSAGVTLTIVDASADFRYADGEAYAAVYGQPHGAPQLLADFSSAVPEHCAHASTPHIGHPGCFATAMQLALVPLMRIDSVDAHVFANGITGATGAGKQPTATTHHPQRHSNLFAYKALSHRHAPEVVAQVAAASGRTPKLHFTPHSGPFSRGIHMTINARCNEALDADALRQAFSDYYRGAPFVRIVDGLPQLKNIVASNYADIGVASDGDSVCVTVVIDNLMKGAAGGCLQWLNRLLGLEETVGLVSAAPGWT